MQKFAATLLLAAAVCLPAQAKEIIINNPQVEFVEKTHDFGTITQYKTVEHVFPFKNTGTETLKILDVHASCGCTAALASANEIPAGESGELKVTFNSGDFSGNVQKTITVMTNDPAQKEVRLAIKANILADIIANPMSIDFGQISLEELPSQTVDIFSPSGKKFKIESARPLLDFLKTEITQPDEDGQGAQVKISIATPPAGGAFNGAVQVKAMLDKEVTLNIYVQGYVRSRTEITPPKLFFGVVNPDEHPERVLTITANSWEGLKVTSVDAPAQLKTTVKEVEEGKKWQVAVKLDGPFNAGMFKDTIKIHLNDKQMQEVDVKVYALINKPKD